MSAHTPITRIYRAYICKNIIKTGDRLRLLLRFYGFFAQPSRARPAGLKQPVSMDYPLLSQAVTSFEGVRKGGVESDPEKLRPKSHSLASANAPQSCARSVGVCGFRTGKRKRPDHVGASGKTCGPKLHAGQADQTLRPDTQTNHDCSHGSATHGAPCTRAPCAGWDIEAISNGKKQPGKTCSSQGFSDPCNSHNVYYGT